MKRGGLSDTRGTGLSGHLPQLPLCARMERPGEFRGAWTDRLGKISHAANSTLAGDGRTFQETGLSYPSGFVPDLYHGRVGLDKSQGRGW